MSAIYAIGTISQSNSDSITNFKEVRKLTFLHQVPKNYINRQIVKLYGYIDSIISVEINLKCKEFDKCKQCNLQMKENRPSRHSQQLIFDVMVKFTDTTDTADLILRNEKVLQLFSFTDKEIKDLE